MTKLLTPTEYLSVDTLNLPQQSGKNDTKLRMHVAVIRLILSYGVEAVSYTHLDVYKRQT